MHLPHEALGISAPEVHLNSLSCSGDDISGDIVSVGEKKKSKQTGSCFAENRLGPNPQIMRCLGQWNSGLNESRVFMSDLAQY